MRMNYLPAIIVAAFSLSAVAQTRVCIGGELDSLTPAELTACKAKAAHLQSTAAHMGMRDDWHLVLVCDEAGWRDYAAFANKNVHAVMRTDEQTDVFARTTFVRGSRLEASQSDAMDRLLASAVERIPAAARPAVAKPRPQPVGELLASVSTHEDSRQEP